MQLPPTMMKHSDRMACVIDAVYEALVGPYPQPYSELEQAYFGIYLFARIGRPRSLGRLARNLNA